MSAPIALVPNPPVADVTKKAVITILREALADAEADKVFGVIVLSKETDGMWMHRASASISVREEVGSIFMLLWDRIARTREAVEE